MTTTEQAFEDAIAAYTRLRDDLQERWAEWVKGIPSEDLPTLLRLAMRRLHTSAHLSIEYFDNMWSVTLRGRGEAISLAVSPIAEKALRTALVAMPVLSIRFRRVQ